MVHSKPHTSGRSTRETASGRIGSAAQTSFDPWIIWVTFRRCWSWAMPMGVVLAIAAASIVMYTFEPTYKATHLLEASHDYLAFEGVMPDIKDLAKTEKQVVLNAVVIDPVLALPELRAAPSLSDPAHAETTLRKNLAVSSSGADSQMEISYIDTDPEAAANVCNAIVDSYLSKRNALDNSRISNLAKWLEPEIETWEREVQLKQRNVQKLSEANKGYDSEQTALIPDEGGALSNLAILRSQITNLRVELKVIETQESMDASKNADSLPAQDVYQPPEITFERIDPTEAEITSMVDADDAVRDAVAQVRHYKAKLTMLEDGDLDRINRDHFREMQGKLDLWTANLEQAKTDARQGVIDILTKQADAALERRKVEARNMMTARRAELKSQHYQAQSLERAQQNQNQEELLAKLEVLQKEHEQQTFQEELRRKQLGGAAAELQFAQQELDIATGVLTKLRDRHAAIRTERQRYGAVRTIAAATVPKTPHVLFPWPTMLATSGLFFAMPFLLGLLWEQRIQRVTDIATVEKSGHLAPIIGEVARLPGRIGKGRNRRVYEESVDALRANLLMSLDTKDIRSIAVTSSMTGEGKSTVASQLAIAIARATGESVLLIDADLRSPDQHEIFGLELGSGLCGVLAGEVDFESAIDKSLGNHVHVLPAGRLNQSPHRIMRTESLRDVVNIAAADYQHVVIDTAPVLSASETLAVSSAVDATLVCVMRDVSRMENVTRTTRRLEAAGANIAGTVFSGVAANRYAYRYGDYHYSLEARTEDEQLG